MIGYGTNSANLGDTERSSNIIQFGAQNSCPDAPEHASDKNLLRQANASCRLARRFLHPTRKSSQVTEPLVVYCQHRVIHIDILCLPYIEKMRQRAPLESRVLGRRTHGSTQRRERRLGGKYEKPLLSVFEFDWLLNF